MKHKAIAKGDYVRFIVTSYYEIGKSGYNQPDFLGRPEDSLSEVVLGGKYLVEKVQTNQWGVRMYELSYMNSIIPMAVPEVSLKKDSEVNSCQFKAGDRVIFNRKLEEKDSEYLKSFFPNIP